MNADAPPSVSAAPARLAALLQNEALLRVFGAVDQGDEETRIVGGAVRDALVDRPLHEIDLATTALPTVVVERAQSAGIRAIPTGVEHGTVTLRVDGQSFETTTLRQDVTTDGRRASVRFGRDFRADALRRDFTINALYLSKHGQVFDYVGGLADLEAGRLRFIGEAAQRIREDYLRILRFFRFSAEFATGAFNEAGRLAAIHERGGLARLSRERVRAELLKLVVARRAAEAAQEMSEAGLLGPLLASAPNAARLAKMARFENGPPDALLRLASLCVELPEDAERLGLRLRLSNGERQRLARAAQVLIVLHGHTPPPEAELRRLSFLHGREAAADGLALAASAAAEPAGWGEARSFVIAAPEPRLPFSGADLLSRGLAGREVGDALAVLTQRWIGAGFPDDPRELEKMVDETAGARERRAR